jgi:hypothetical protein
MPTLENTDLRANSVLDQTIEPRSEVVKRL